MYANNGSHNDARHAHYAMIAKRSVIVCRATGTQLSKQTPQCLGSAGRILTGAHGSPSKTPAAKEVGVRVYHEVTGDIICPAMVLGMDHLRDPRLNKVNGGLCTSLVHKR